MKRQRDKSNAFEPDPSPASTSPSTIAAPAPSAFPEDPKPMQQERRGPGRPPKICDKCFLPASECKCSAAAVPPPAFDEATIKFVFAGFSQLMAMSLSISTGVEMGPLAKVWEFQPGEVMLLTPPATTLANKYLPDMLKGFQDELKLLMVLLPILISKVAITKAIVSAKKLQTIPPRQTPVPASESVPRAGTPLEQAAAA